MAELLLDQPLVDRAAYDAHGSSSLHYAVEHNALGLLRSLLGSGGPPVNKMALQALTLRNQLGWAPLHTAAFRGHHLALRTLLEAGAPVDEESADGWTALQLAASQGRASIVRLLLDVRASIDHGGRRGESALALATAAGHTSAAQLLSRPAAVASHWE